MPVAYFEPSALVKLVVREPDSDVATALWNGSDAVLSSLMSYPEVRAALAAAHRDRRLRRGAYVRAKEAFETCWSSLRLITPTRPVIFGSGEIAERFRLAGYDAVHLASCLIVGEDDLVAVSWDDRFRHAASDAGLRVAPARSR